MDRSVRTYSKYFDEDGQPTSHLETLLEMYDNAHEDIGGSLAAFAEGFDSMYDADPLIHIILDHLEAYERLTHSV